MIAALVDRTLQTLDTALKDAGITAGELDKILFVGGSTREPLVWERVAEHSGLDPEMAVNPDEAVALGAAVQAAIIVGEPLEAYLDDQDQDEEDILEGEAQAKIIPSNQEAQTLLNRARLLLESNPNDAPLAAAIDSLEEALRRGDEGETDTRQEALLDLIYDRGDR